MDELPKQLIAELDALWRFALRLTGNTSDAEDLVQRTCVKALENAHRYQPENRLRSWLFRIEHRAWLNLLRSRRVRQDFAQQSVIAGQESGTSSQNSLQGQGHQGQMGEQAETPESTLELQQLLAAVEALSEPQRVVVILVCVEGLTYEEAAQVLDVPMGTVMSRLSRARKQLASTQRVSHHFCNTQKSGVELSVVQPTSGENKGTAAAPNAVKTEQVET